MDGNEYKRYMNDLERKDQTIERLKSQISDLNHELRFYKLKIVVIKSIFSATFVLTFYVLLSPLLLRLVFDWLVANWGNLSIADRAGVGTLMLAIASALVGLLYKLHQWWRDFPEGHYLKLLEKERAEKVLRNAHE